MYKISQSLGLNFSQPLQENLCAMSARVGLTLWHCQEQNFYQYLLIWRFDIFNRSTREVCRGSEGEKMEGCIRNIEESSKISGRSIYNDCIIITKCLLF